MNVIEKFKKNKNAMLIKMEQANLLAETAAGEFVNSAESLVNEISREELEEFLECKDGMIDADDKLMVATMFAKIHEDCGIVVIGIN